MFGIADHGAFCAAILLFLALPGPGTFALLSASNLGGPRGAACATTGMNLGDQALQRATDAAPVAFGLRTGTS